VEKEWVVSQVEEGMDNARWLVGGYLGEEVADRHHPTFGVIKGKVPPETVIPCWPPINLNQRAVKVIDVKRTYRVTPKAERAVRDQKIREMVAAGFSIRGVAKKFGIDRKLVRMVLATHEKSVA
jgi:hypothetical protein